MTLKRRSIKLSPADWQQLQEVAAATNSLATKGVKTGQPSWRALVRRIAQKELKVTVKTCPEVGMLLESGMKVRKIDEEFPIYHISNVGDSPAVFCEWATGNISGFADFAELQRLANDGKIERHEITKIMIGTQKPCPWCEKVFSWIMASCGAGTTWSLYKCPECEKFIARGWAIPDAVRENPDTKIIETEPIGASVLAV